MNDIFNTETTSNKGVYRGTAKFLDDIMNKTLCRVLMLIVNALLRQCSNMNSKQLDK